jgi:chemotaxis protein MotB
MKTILGCALVLAMAGCVSQGKYDRAVAETQTTRAELGKKSVALEQANADLDRQRGEIHALETQLEQLTTAAFVAGADKSAQIDAMKKRLDELRAAHSAAEARAIMFRGLARKLAKEIDAGDLLITIRDQRMVLQLPDDVLFDSGRAALKPAGKATLESVAIALQSLPTRQFQVAGHTDNEPIKKSPFASNWELSTARALTVVHFLLAQGIQAPSLSAAGYGEVDPIAANDTPDGRRKNRRTEITIQPSIDEIVHVP